MRWDSVYVGAATVRLGRREPIRPAVTAGRYSLRTWRRDGYDAVCVAERGSAEQLTHSAASHAVRTAGRAGRELDLVVHAQSTRCGSLQGTAGARVRETVAGHRATTLEVVRPAGGGVLALHTAAAYLDALDGDGVALVATTDAGGAAGCDRYRHTSGAVLGDGSTGLVLTRTGGVARLLSTAVLGEPPEGTLFRADLAWREAPSTTGCRHRADDGPGAASLLATRERDAVRAAVAEAGHTLDDVARFVFSNVGRDSAVWRWRTADGIDESRTTWSWGRQVGHLGAGDQIAGLAHLLETGGVRPGDLVALVGGCPRTVGCAVVEILR
ncbi:3-oxoacyl-[acyl-carrier-protein] synthase III C-terminal domain-containing protein [Streptomyces roseolus]|uniref:3-oxoacyl-[acyl-carrier-protein] synthase III C-terminal domain-containing protein n=1 Tax=Streptomyces roseolus TaxID=67358 RepID=UPI00365DA5B4